MLVGNFGMQRSTALIQQDVIAVNAMQEVLPIRVCALCSFEFSICYCVLGCAF